MAAPQQHRYDIIATNLIFISFLLGIAVDFFTHTGVFNFQSKILSKQFFFIALAFGLLLALVHCYYIRQGYRWAKILYFILFGMQVLFTILDFKGIAAKQFVSPLKEVNYAVQWLVGIVVCSLLVISYRSTQWHAKPLPTTEV